MFSLGEVGDAYTIMDGVSAREERKKLSQKWANREL